MCCDVCPKFDECDEKGRLKERCCAECPEYEYCKGEDERKHTGSNDNADDNNPEIYD